ncbi:hypothetical protein ACTXT7_001361 [Hymenolepis weldensis]
MKGTSMLISEIYLVPTPKLAKVFPQTDIAINRKIKRRHTDPNTCRAVRSAVRTHIDKVDEGTYGLALRFALPEKKGLDSSFVYQFCIPF